MINSIQNPKVLITGASGLLGKSLSKLLSQKELPIVTRSKHQLDVTSYSSICANLDQHQPDIIINCAAFTQVDAAESHAEKCFAINAFGPALLAHACQLRGIWLIHISTDFVFDGTSTFNDETTPTNPLSIYGRSKLAGEDAIRRICKSSTIIRTSWLFGSSADDFVSKILRLIQTKPSIDVLSNQIGTPTYVDHLSEAINALIRANVQLSLKFGLFHYAGWPSASRYEWAQIIKGAAENHLNRKLVCNLIPSQYFSNATAVRPKHSALVSDKLCNLISYSPSLWTTVMPQVIQERLSNENR